MHFSASEVIKAPRDRVFDEIADFDGFERQIVRAGGEVTRSGPAGPDATWTGAFNFRGTRRTVTAHVADWAPPGGYRITAQTGGLTSLVDVRCVAVDDSTTRLDVLVDLKPQGITARVLLNSVKLMRTQANKRFKRRVRDFATGVAHRAAKAG